MENKLEQLNFHVYCMSQIAGVIFFFFFVQQFITWCSIAVRGKLPTTSSSQVPQRKEPPITGREIQSHQNRDLT